MSNDPTLATPAEIWWADLGQGMSGEPSGYRPVVILSPELRETRVMPCVTVIPMTRSRRTYRYRLPIEPGPSHQLTETTYAQVELVRTISKNRLLFQGGHVTGDDWRSIRELLREYLRIDT